MFEPTLVQYENPQMITERSMRKTIEENKVKAEKMALMTYDELVAESTASGLDLLDVLIPPRIAEQDGELWYQRASRSPASSTDLHHLRERLDGELLRRGAREIGLCDARRALYDQLFDELTRQEAVTCPERGRLLRMVRREAELSISAVLGCYESGLAYGIKKKLSALRDRRALDASVSRLLARIAGLNAEAQELEPEAAEVREAMEVKMREEERKFGEEEEELERENKKLLQVLRDCIDVTLKEEEEEKEEEGSGVEGGM